MPRYKTKRRVGTLRSGLTGLSQKKRRVTKGNKEKPMEVNVSEGNQCKDGEVITAAEALMFLKTNEDSTAKIVQASPNPKHSPFIIKLMEERADSVTRPHPELANEDCVENLLRASPKSSPFAIKPLKWIADPTADVCQGTADVIQQLDGSSTRRELRFRPRFIVPEIDGDVSPVYTCTPCRRLSTEAPSLDDNQRHK